MKCCSAPRHLPWLRHQRGTEAGQAAQHRPVEPTVTNGILDRVLQYQVSEANPQPNLDASQAAVPGAEPELPPVEPPPDETKPT